MNEASAYLLKLARRIVEPYKEQRSVRAIMITGSVAEGNADCYSDLDLIAYYDELPSEEALAAARQRNNGQNFAWLFNDRAQGSIAEAYDVYGVQCQVMHTEIRAWEQHMSTVLEQLDVATPLHKAMSGIQQSIPLHGADLIQRWKDRVASYPEPLARAMIEQHLRFFPMWGLHNYLDTRDAVLWRYQMLLEAAQNLLGVLAGLNRLYYTTFQFKRMRLFIAKLTLAPDNLAARLEHLFETDPASAGAELEQLVQEVVELVERNRPEIDTSSVRSRLGWRRPAWQILGDDERSSDA